MLRKVTVYNTIGGNMTPLETSASTWAELQRDLDTKGVSYSGMSAVIGATQLSLESPAAQLPMENFQLFLAPKKVKSGNDESLISFDGINWNDEEWANDYTAIEDCQFKSLKDLTIARAKKTQYYLQKMIDYLLSSEGNRKFDDPEVIALRNTAEDIKRNLGLYD